MQIRTFQPEDEADVVALWERCDLTRPWNDPHKDIARKLTEQPELFLVGIKEEELIATVMAGFDGHRGQIYYLAVAPDWRQQSLGRRLMQEVERRLIARGCPKINLQVRSSNAEVIAFYRQLGYSVDEIIGLGKRLIDD
ncbi:MAG: GNAT family acetyltransferase [Methylococcaceae bacterium]|nr:GNAT family acetyltransferase [Methylococcaceae bacterium]